MSDADFSIDVQGPFELQAAVDFGSGWEGGSFGEDGERVVRLAFALDDFSGHACVALSQRGSRVDGWVEGTDAVDVAKQQTARILSLDVDGREYPAVGERDPVIGRLQAERPGLRPVCFHSPYEAAAWSIISARTPHAAARKMRAKLSAEFGRTFEGGGIPLHAFPLPEQLLAIDGPVPGLPEEKLRRLHDVARAALEGLLDADALRAMDREDAEAQLQSIRGIGPFYSQLILIRAAGTVDGFVTGEKRLRARIAELYGADAEPEAVAEVWRPFRTWTAVLVRATA